MTRAAEAVIDLHALHQNLRRVREAAPAARVMAVIKANGYGHGMLRAARALEQVDAFAVARIEEGVALRAAGIVQPITLLEGFLDAAELEAVCRHNLGVVVHHEAQVEILERAVLARPIEAWLKVDTGMHRLGFAPELAAAAWRRLHACPGVAAPLRLMTHLANADDRHDPFTPRQMGSFAAALEGIDGERSIANSAAILGWPEAHGEWVRPGLMLYGVSPFLNGRARQEGLRPVMTLRSRLIAVRRLSKGDAVGYGSAWTCPEDMPMGVVAVGYGDGYPRHAGSGTPVLINGRRVPLVGRVSMDMICVDLRGAPEAAVGDEAVLWGAGLPVEEIAEHASTIPYELLCAVSQRVEFLEC